MSMFFSRLGCGLVGPHVYAFSRLESGLVEPHDVYDFFSHLGCRLVGPLHGTDRHTLRRCLDPGTPLVARGSRLSVVRLHDDLAGNRRNLPPHLHCNRKVTGFLN